MYLGNLYYIVGSHLWIHFIFSSSSRRTGACFRRYNSRTHSITNKANKKFRQVHTIEYTHKQLFTLRSILKQCTLLQVLIYEFAWFLAHLREGLEPVFGVITLRYIQQSTHINNYLHLGPYLNNVLYCRFSFMNSLYFWLVFETGSAPLKDEPKIKRILK